MKLSAWLCVLVVAGASAAWAQVDLVDPDAPSTKPKKTAKPADDELQPNPDDTVIDEGPLEDTEPGKAVPELNVPITPTAPKEKRDAGVGRDSKDAKKEPGKDGKKEPAPRAPPPPLVVKALADADLERAWTKWKELEGKTDVKAEQAARAELVKMRSISGASNLESWAIGLLRAAEKHEAAGDSGAAVEIAMTAVELAPDLPAAWTGLALTYFRADPSDVGRYLGAFKKGVEKTLGDARYLRPFVADIAATLLIAVVFTALVVVVVLFLRRLRYFLHDFHFFFPRAAAHWQTTAMALLLLSLPVVFRMGVAPMLLVLFAAATLYLTIAERIVAAVLIAMLGFVPTLAGTMVEATAFADTAAEDLYLIERGGTGVDDLVQRYERLAAEDKVTFPERFVLGRYHLRRGHLEQAIAHYRSALAIRPEDVPGRVNLAVALFLQGDLENPRSILENVTRDSRNPIALFDQARLYQRRHAVYGDSVAGEVDKANAALVEARTMDATLPGIADEEKPRTELIANEYVRTLPLATDELLGFAKSTDGAERVRSQMTHLLLGDVNASIAPFYPLLAALLLLGFGFLGPALEAARVCNRCGLPVSRRSDPDVSRGSLMCTQCVNVFARKNVVAPSLKVRKQLDVARYQTRMERLSYAFGLACAGMGHVFGGWPVRGAIYGFLFVVAVTAAVLRNGVLRAPYDPLPLVLKAVPMVLLFLLVYLFSLRGLRKRQG